MKSRWLLSCGILASALYVGVVIGGGVLHPGYSHLSSSISALTAVGAPDRELLDDIFLANDGLLMLFALGIFLDARQKSRGRQSGIACAAALIATGLVISLLLLFFPQDAGEVQAAVTPAGTLHIVVASLAAATAMLAILCAALWFREQPELKGYSAYSVATFAVMLISGVFGVAAASSGFPLFGLVERVTIGAFVLWQFRVALKLYRNHDQLDPISMMKQGEL